jgi:hypothetical protein
MTRIRLLLLVEGASFAVASLVHSGWLLPGYEHSKARIAEGVIALVLVLGWIWSSVRPQSIRTTGLAVQGFALLGTLIGLFTIAVGVGPRTTPDIIYHILLIVMLLWGLRVASRGRIEAKEL